MFQSNLISQYKGKSCYTKESPLSYHKGAFNTFPTE